MLLQLALLCFALHNSANGFIAPGDRKWCHGNDDPHMKTFDDRYYEFQRSGRYMLFTNKVDLTVSGAFAPCSVGSTARCGCGLTVRYQNTALRYDRCSVAPVPTVMQFYADTSSATSVPVDCFANTVPVGDETNDAWWNTAGNPVDVNGQLQCAKLGSSSTIVIRTNTGNDAANVYVKATIHDYGMYGIEVGITNYYWQQNIGGLCGYYDGNPGNDFFTDSGVYDPTIPSDFDIVADFWSLKIDGDLFEKLDSIYCPCDNNEIKTKRALARRFECQVPIAVCTLQQKGENVTFQAEVIPDVVQQVSPDDADAKCRAIVDEHLFSKQQEGLLTEQELDEFLQNCITDLLLTGNDYWIKLALKVIEEKADQRELLKPKHRDAWCWSHDDPHMKSFDDLYYEFQVAGSYVLFTNGVNMAVQGSFTPCSYNTAVTCNCGIRVSYIDTALRFDRCTVAPNPAIMKFYADTPFGNSIQIDCGAKIVSPADSINDAWWNIAGNPVNVNGRISCARIGNSNGYMIRTNTGIDAANVYVKVFLHPNGIYSIDIKVTTFYWRRTGGLCGFFDGKPKNDFFTDDGVFDPNNPKDLQIVADFWSLKYPSFNFYDQLSCLCDDQAKDGIIKTKCVIPIAQCTLKQIGADFVVQDVVRDFNATQLNADVAEKICKYYISKSQFFEAVQFGVLTADEVKAYNATCVADMINTGDEYWAIWGAEFTKDLIATRLDTINSNIKYAWCWSHDDPHMKSFDNLYYEFQVAGNYLLFSNGLNMAVQASFTPCSYNAAVTCNCGIRVVYLDTTLRFDRCGVAPNSVIMQFFSDTPFGNSIPTNCAAKTVSPSDETDDTWWNVAGHAVNVNGRISCARIGSSNEYMIRTNTGINAANIYVKVFIHDLGLYSIDVRVSSFYWKKTRGLCGFYDDDIKNDFFTDNGVFDPTNPKDLQIVADFWSLKYPGINAYEQLYCPCDDPFVVDPLARYTQKYKCNIPIAQCTLKALRASFEPQDVIRPVKAVKTNETTATEQCKDLIERNNFKEAVQTGFLTQDQLKQFNDSCVLDISATSDIFWGEKAAEFTQNIINSQWEIKIKPKYAWCYSHDDPHMKTFDDLYYDLHKTGRFILFTNRVDITVAAAFRICNTHASVTCNCGIMVRYLNTTLRFDRCGVVPVPAIMTFYADTPSGYHIPINCGAKTVSSSDETNDAWWNTAGNPVNVNGRILCARIGSSNYYMIRTNTGYNFKNVYVKVYVHAFGIYAIDLRVSSYYYGKSTGGLCGLYNGSPKDDFFTYSNGNVVVYNPYNSIDLVTVSTYWSLRFPSIGTYDRLTCPCDNNLTILTLKKLPTRYECVVPIAECTLSSLGIGHEKVNEVRKVNATIYSSSDAQTYCESLLKPFLTAVQNGYLTKIEFGQFMKFCINDYMNTGDYYWVKLLISYIRDLINSRSTIVPVTTPIPITEPTFATKLAPILAAQSDQLDPVVKPYQPDPVVQSDQLDPVVKPYQPDPVVQSDQLDPVVNPLKK